MDFNDLWNLFTQAGMRPGQPADEHHQAGIGAAEIARFQMLQEQQQLMGGNNPTGNFGVFNDKNW